MCSDAATMMHGGITHGTTAGVNAVTDGAGALVTQHAQSGQVEFLCRAEVSDFDLFVSQQP